MRDKATRDKYRHATKVPDQTLQVIYFFLLFKGIRYSDQIYQKIKEKWEGNLTNIDTYAL